MPQLKVSSALLCEDCRRDENGKSILIGVLAGQVQFRNSLPATMEKLFLYVAGMAIPSKFKFEYRLCEKGKSKPISGGQAELDYEGEEVDAYMPLDLALPFGPTTFSNAGVYFAQIRLDESNWKKVAEVDIQSISADR